MSTIMREYVMPLIQASRKLYRRKLRGVFTYILCMAGLLLCYELFINRKVHRPVMNLCKSKPKRRVGGMPDVAKEERVARLEQMLKKNKEERLKATAKFIENTNAKKVEDDQT